MDRGDIGRHVATLVMIGKSFVLSQYRFKRNIDSVDNTYVCEHFNHLNRL